MSRIKATTLTTREQFNAAVDSAANLDTMIRYINARRDRAIQRIQIKFGMKTAPLEVQRDAQVGLAEKYADAHRAELLPDEKKKKSGDTATATFGWRDGNRTVRATSKRVTEETAIAVLKAERLGDYVRTKEELAKAKILNDAVDDKTLSRIVLDPVGEAVIREGEYVMEKVELAKAGLQITQTETFFIEPKVETAATLKSKEAA